MERLFGDTPTEGHVLAGIARYGYNGYIEVSEILTVNTFTLERNQLLFRIFQHIFEESQDAKIDIPLILGTATKLGFGDYFKGETTHLDRLLIFPIELSTLQPLAALIRKRELKEITYNELISCSKEVAELNDQASVDEMLALPEQALVRINKSIISDADTVPVTEDIYEILQYLEDNPIEYLGIPCGYRRLDEVCGGFLRPGAISVVAARQGEGKSQTVSNIATQTAKLHSTPTYKFPVLYLDTEMTRNDVLFRMLARFSKVDVDLIEKGKYASSKFQKTKVLNAAKDLEDLNIDYNYVGGMSFSEIISVMRRWVYKTVGFNDDGTAKQCLIVYDYLKMMDEGDLHDNMSETQKFGFIMSSLHDFAQKYQVAILTAVQTNREGIKEEHQGVISQSDRIGYYATSIVQWKSKDEKDIEEGGEEEGNYKLIVLKARFGPGLKRDYINMKFHGNISLIEEGRCRSEVPRKPKPVQEDNDGPKKLTLKKKKKANLDDEEDATT